MSEELLDTTSEDTRSNDDLDKLADSSDQATNRERPMGDEPAKAEKSAEKTADELFEFSHNGKKVQGTREQLIKWAQMGYDRPQFAQKLNAEKAKWESERQKWEKDWGVYKQIDDYAKQNQDWWKFVEQNWQSRGTQTTQPGTQAGVAPANDPYASKFQLLEQKLSQFEPLLHQVVETHEQQQARAEDEKLEGEIQSLRDKHSDLDWESLDENGKSLEHRVLEHAQQNGIPTFRAAMRDLLHDELISKAESLGKIAVARGIQQRTKLGVLGDSPTPSRSMPKNNKPIRQTSYEELEAEIREELKHGLRA